MTTNNSIALTSGTQIQQRLLDREKAILVEAERMQAIMDTSSEAPVHWQRPDYRGIMRNAKKHIEALRAGLPPVRIIGKHFRIVSLLHMGVPVPSQITETVNVAKQRLPGGEARVYGLDNAVDPVTGGPVAGEVRRRDPVVTYHYGDREFFLGFWLELDTDMETPEFLGVVQPWAPKRGRGRPPKGLPW